MRFPWPSQPVAVVLQKRQADNTLRADLVDRYRSRFARSSTARRSGRTPGPSGTLFENGPAPEKVDLLVIGEGYTEAELPKFHTDASRLVEALFAHEPFKSRRRDFNVRALDLPSAESGVNRPNAGVFRRTPLSAEYNIFDSERYVLTLDNRALRDAASAAPYEFIEILVNERTYGGGGIFNDQATAVGRQRFRRLRLRARVRPSLRRARRRVLHVGCRLRDRRRGPKPEPWEPNVTALADPAALKWRDLVAPGTPLPTPWEKEAFERAQPRDPGTPPRDPRSATRRKRRWMRSFASEREWEEKLLGGMKYSKTVGAFEGASYEARGLYRPAGRLHHVHPRPRRLLSRLPARASAGSSTCTRSSSGIRASPTDDDDRRARSTIRQSAAIDEVIHALWLERVEPDARQIAAEKPAAVRVVVDAAAG